MTAFGSGSIVVGMLWWAAVSLTLVAVAVVVQRLLRSCETGPAAIAVKQVAAELTPVQLGYLRNGSGPAVAAALASLRMRGLVCAETGRDEPALGHLPSAATDSDATAELDPFHREVLRLAEADGEQGVTGIAGQMKGLLRAVEDELIARGVHTSRLHRFLLCLVATPPVLAVVGGLPVQVVARSGAGFGWFIAEFVVLIAVCICALQVARATPAGDAVLAVARRRWDCLKPSQRPAFTTYGPDAAALSVALFGGAALWLLDPAFAQRYGVGGSEAKADSCGACGAAACGEPEFNCGG